MFDPKKAPDGVIHVVANGFVALRSEEARKLEAAAWPELEKFLDLRRQQELEELGQVCGHLRNLLRRGNRPSWMLVAVAKVDLFQGQLASAEDWYGSSSRSPFAEHLRQLQWQIGADRFQWAAAPVCAWPEDFDFGDTTIASSFKIPERDHYLATFMETLDGLTQREVREAPR